MRGTVKWFNNAKGFGFLTSPQVEGDIFAHYSKIEQEGYRSLKAGEAVQFELAVSDKGASAEHIAKVSVGACA